MSFYETCDLCEVQCGKIYIKKKEGLNICSSCATHRSDLTSDIFPHIDNIVIKNDLECPICLDTARCIQLPKCSHFCCIDCFKKLYYGYTELKKPQNVYPSIQDPYIVMFPDASDNQLDYEIQYKYEQYIDWSYHFTFANTKEDEEYMKEVRSPWMNTEEFLEWEEKKNKWEDNELKLDKERDKYQEDKNKKRNPYCPLCRQ
jgi:hypothetical protein